MMTTDRSTKIVNFMTPGAGVLVLGCGHISHSGNALLLLKIFFPPMHTCGSDKLSI